MGARGNFFAVDRRVWDRLCAFPSINMVVAYLVVARGTLGDLRTSAWSATAVEQYTGISWRAAKVAIGELIKHGFIEQRRGGKKPRYFLLPAETATPKTQLRERCLKPPQALLLEAAAAHPDGIFLPRKDHVDPNWPEGVSWGAAQALIMDGLVRKISPTGIAPVEQVEPGRDGEWIWLPNTVVDGAADEMPPVERLRQSQSITALQLYVDLYDAHAISEAGGVSFREIRASYERHHLGNYSAYALYRFMPKTIEAFPNAPFFAKYLRNQYVEYEDDLENMSAEKRAARRKARVDAFWADLKIVRDTGLAEFVPHLVDADNAEGVVIHPLALAGEGEATEQEIGAAAQAAAFRMLTAIGQRGPWDPDARFVPMEPHVQHLALVGVLRLRHRPHTTVTAAWIEGNGGWVEGAERYRRLETAISAAA